MGLDEIFGLLFVLYILGSIVGALMRGGASQRRSPELDDEAPGEILDMEELERRLRRMREEMLGQPPSPPGEGPRPVVPPAGPAEPPGRPGAEPLAPGAPAVPLEPAASPPAAASPQQAARRAPAEEGASSRAAGEPVTVVPVRPEARPTAQPTVRPSTVRPSPMRPVPLRPMTMRPSTGRPSESADEWPAIEEWDDWPADPLEPEALPARRGHGRSVPGRPGRRPGAPGRRIPGPTSGDGLPPAVAALLERGQPWLAAVVIKEIWEKPRALRPYRLWPRV
ncbi:MAG TPA: hypothetical protein VIK93_02335 [Limnochordales bacterium]